MRRRRALLGIFAVLYAMFIGVVTLTPDPFSDGVDGTISRVLDAFSQRPLTAWLTYEFVEFAANIGMFVPLGLLVALWAGRRRWWLGIVVGMTYTILIEAFQGTVLSATRYATVSDIIANALGALLGAAIARAVHAAARNRAARSRDSVSVR